MHRFTRRGLWSLVAFAATLALAPPVAATSTYTATGSVSYGSGQPVPGRAVIVRRATINGASTVTVYTNGSGVFSSSWTAASGVIHYVTVTVEGASNSVTGTPSRQINWWGGGTRNFGVWTVLGGPPGPAGDVDRDGISDAEESRLLQKFAPQLRFHPDEWNWPANVDWILARSHMNYSHLGGFLFFGCNDHEILGHGTPTYGTGTATDITAQQHQSATGWPSCDHTGIYHRSDSYSPDTREGFFLQQYNPTHSGASLTHDWVVYGHVYPHRTGEIVVQYWFFYAYNDGYLTFNHESDWEHVLVVVDPQNSDAVLDVRYSKHDTPTTYTWNQLTKVNTTHPVVYVAKGSHANYRTHLTLLDRELCDNSFKILGHAVDECDDGGVVWNTWDSVAFGGLVNVGESHFTMEADWLRYSGRWGEIGNTEGWPLYDTTSGKKGPAYQPSFWRYCGSPEFCSNGLDDDVDGVVDEPQCSALPDLALEGLNPTLFAGGLAGRSLMASGDSIYLQGSIVNEGSTVTGSFTTRVALSTDENYDDGDPQLLAVTIPGLHQTTVYGLDTSTAYAMPALADGIYYLVGKTDSANAVTEGFEGETNNTGTAEFQVEVDSHALRLENFNDGVANGFTTNFGTWDATGGSYLATGTGLDQNATVALVPSSEASVTMDFDFWVTDQGVGTQYQPYLGAILRYQDATHFLRVDTYRMSGTSYVRLLGWNGTHQVLATSTLSYAVDKGLHHMKIEDRGCQIKVFLDDTQVLIGTYSGPVPQSYRGLFVNIGTQVGFDNFRIRLLEDEDGDGWNAVCGDCNDQNFNVNPGRTENCCTSYDDNCNGTTNEGCSGGCGGGGCFATGTAITMADGSTRPIQSLRPGDEVLSYDEGSGKLVPGKVLETFRHDRADEMVVINGSLHATPNHQLFANKAWLPIDGVMQKDALTVLASSNTTKQEVVLSVTRVPGSTSVHDIEVSGLHNYFANGVLVHNKVVPVESQPMP